MAVEIAPGPLAEVGADIHVVPLLDGVGLPDEYRSAPGAADAKPGYRKLALLHPTRPERLLAAGLGKPDELDAERLRVVAALAAREAAKFEAGSIAWSLPAEGIGAAEAAAAIVEGTTLAAWRFDRFKSSDPDEPSARVERLVLAVHGDEQDEVGAAARTARIAAEAANRARELASLPANIATPTFLADRARELSVAYESLTVEVLGREDAERLGMGGFVAVARGTAEEPRLIVMRYSGGGPGETLGLVGKAVTFDTGGISIKPAQRMAEMKMDMSGGAAVIEAVAAIAELGLELDLVAVVPATENMPSGTATRPGDIITQLNGKTVEVMNTDAEGRLILADALTYCVRELGADRVVDLATLTGAVVVALGSTYAGLIANDDGWAAAVTAAAEESGELAWRLPLHLEYKELTKGADADLTNASSKRKASTIYAGSFLEEFVDGKPWVHLDIAGTAWDVGRPYVGKGASGFGVRLLVALARSLARAPDAVEA